VSYRALGFLCLACAVGAAPLRDLSAQESRVRGVVIDSAVGRPLGDVRVQIRGTQWATRTRADGRFSLPSPSGPVVVVAQRLGYEQAELAVEAGTRAADSVVVRLRERPASISGVLVEAPAAPPMAQTISATTMRQLPPLVEPDVFRALAFVPGVLQPSDLRGRMHIAGGRSDETGIRINGHPLHNPFHVAELLSGFSVAAVERADIMMHHIPAEYADHLSGVVDIATRRPTARSANEATVSLVSSSFTSAQPKIVGTTSLLASGRVTYLDKFLRLRYSESYLASHDVFLYGFVDGILAAEQTWENGTRLQVTAFRTKDEIDVSSSSRERIGWRPYGWGEWLLGASLGRSLGTTGWEGRVSFGRGAARFDSGVDRQPGGSPPGANPRSYLATSNDRLSAAARLGWQRERWSATAGLTFDRWRAVQRWRGTDLTASDDAPFQFNGADLLNAASAIGTVTIAPRGRLSAGAHTRLWVADGRFEPAPGAWLSARLTPSLTAHLSLERRLQFDAELAEPELGIGRAPVFLLGVPREARVAGFQLAWVSAARRRAAGDSVTPRHALTESGPLQLRGQAFLKEYARATRLPEQPIPAYYEVDTVPPPGFPNFIRGGGRSYGFMIGGRLQPHGRLFLEGGYTYQRAFQEVDGLLSPSDWDAPHQASGFASFLLGRKWTLTVAGHARSGLPQTGVARRVLEPTVSGGLSQRYVPGPRNGVQLPGYYRLDAGVRRTSSEGRAAWTFNFQLINLLFRRNPTSYDWLSYYCGRDPECSSSRGGRETLESFSLPIIPSFGFEFRW
jgi:hypothetical protein